MFTKWDTVHFMFWFKETKCLAFFSLSYLTEALLFSVFVFNLKNWVLFFNRKLFFLDRDTSLSEFFILFCSKGAEWILLRSDDLFWDFCYFSARIFQKYFPKIKTLKGRKKDSRNFPFVFWVFSFCFFIN